MTTPFGRSPDSPLPTLFVLLGLKFNSGLNYRAFAAQLSFTPKLLGRLGLSRAPSCSILQQALNRQDTHLLSSIECADSWLTRDLLLGMSPWAPPDSLTPLEVSGCIFGSERG